MRAAPDIARAQWALTAIAAVLLAACGGGRPSSPVPGADPQRGQALIVQTGCGACHQIAGVEGADGHVGPPLTHLKARRVIAGKLPNTPQNAARWIEDPHRFLPQTVMPDLGLSRRQALDVTAYLYAH